MPKFNCSSLTFTVVFFLENEAKASQSALMISCPYCIGFCRKVYNLSKFEENTFMKNCDIMKWRSFYYNINGTMTKTSPFLQNVTLQNNPSFLISLKRFVCLGVHAYQQFFSYLMVALQIFGRKFYKNTEKSSLYSESLWIFIHKTPVVESYQITREIKRFTTAQVNTDGKYGLFLNEQLTHLHTKNTQMELQT